MQIRPFSDGDEDAVIALWQEVGITRPWNDPHKDIARKRRVQRDLFLVALADDVVVGTVMAGYDGHRGWVNYLAVAPARQRRGIARALMAAVEVGLAALGCPKVNLQVRTGNADALGFYARLGYGRDEVVTLGKRLEPD
jgi:ribosomal protein S18 acetylase RimI-like enzyme